MSVNMASHRNVLVVAHPDDEVLWFSSVLQRVDVVVICFLRVEQSTVTAARERSLKEHVHPNVVSLKVDEGGVFGTAAWDSPLPSQYGLALQGRRAARRYEENYRTLKRLLGAELQDCQSVITHNPWGEYGHEEHVQVYRVVRQLAGELNYDVWFSNYCSNRTVPLMLQYCANSGAPQLKRLPTNPVIAIRMMDIYKEYGCWTWYDDWVWSQEESFLNDSNCAEDVERANGHPSAIPINFISRDLGVCQRGRVRGSIAFTHKICQYLKSFREHLL